MLKKFFQVSVCLMTLFILESAKAIRPTCGSTAIVASCRTYCKQPGQETNLRESNVGVDQFCEKCVMASDHAQKNSGAATPIIQECIRYWKNKGYN